MKNLIKTYNDELSLINLYKNNTTFDELRNIFKCGTDKLHKILLKHNIPIRTRRESIILNKGIKLPKDEIIDLYMNKVLNTIQIAKRYNCNHSTISKFLNNNGIKVYKRRLKPRIKKEKKIKVIDEKLFLREYNQLNLNVKQLFKKHNLTKREGYKILHRNGIYNRPVEITSMLQFNSLKKSFRYKNYTLPSGKSIKLQGYEPQFLDYIFKNNVLIENEIEHESIKINYIDKNNKQRIYVPDFYISKWNLIVEIKAKYIYEVRDIDINEKREATIKKGYNFLILIDNNFESLKEFIK